ncbi:AAA family ATPase [Paracoccus versutus]|uniref:ATP-binding protein involved in virulence n=1 Tax=Paracoccus versutus TaxID=34007 RepID=A0AAQ0KMF5_PARVE|nr:AAA family ATPase [Paracoccus versutus]KGJ11947.1 ATPase AAA [Paracoccus versutus]REG54061.1 putative ATP-binding protein involved in virulence [Paracoccus versutus]WEJ79251.1 AAA family ATPase [Paracoccus versutus]
MRIRELTIQSYRAFGEQQTFLFSPSFTAIAGINGRGKTSLLDGLALLASRILPHISPARSGYRTLGPLDLHDGHGPLSLSMKINCGDIPIEFGVSLDEDSKSPRVTKLPPAVKKAARNIYGDPTRADDAAPLVVFFTTDRAGYRLPKKLPTAVPRGQAAAYAGALFNRTVNFRDFMARYHSAIVIEDEETRRNPNYIGDRAVGAISEALTTFLGGFRNLRVEQTPLRLLIDKDNQSFDISQLSDGERSFLALICDLGRRLALANPELTNPLHGAGVVLIDEIELHLHPRWQREVRDKLLATFPNVQFVATTHSPFVIQSMKPGELINLDPDEFAEYSDKSIEDISENVMGVDLPQKSKRYRDMMKAAEEYFTLVRQPSPDRTLLALAESRLNELSVPFSDDPAFQALLKLERKTKGREGGDASS